MVEIFLLGPLRVVVDGRDVPATDLRGKLGRSLVALLASRRGTFVSRDQLTEALWPKDPPSDPASSLKVLVSRARQALGDHSLILTRPGGYELAQGAGIWIDAETFFEQVAAGTRLMAAGRASEGLAAFEAALARWAEPLPEFAYTDWAVAWRVRLARARLEALEGGSAAALAAGDYKRAMALAEEAVALEPLREPSHMLLVKARAASGDSAGALAAFDELRRRLAEELGLDPSAEAFDVQRWILRGARTGGRVDTPALRPSPAQRGELPFVGRESEMATITSALAEPAPQVVLVEGPPGSGKTRLLTEVARSIGETVVDARAYLPEVDEPWSLARSLIRKALVRHPSSTAHLPAQAAGALAGFVPEVDHLRDTDQHPASAESRRALALEGAAELLRAVARAGATLLVDDLQWADATSLALIWRLVREDDGPKLLMAHRPDERLESHIASLRRDFRGPAPVRHIVLDELEPDAIRSIISDPQLARLLVDTTGSMPFPLHESLRDLVDHDLVELDGAGRWRLSGDAAFEDAFKLAQSGRERSIVRRLESVAQPARKTAALLALLGRETPARVVSRILEREETAVIHDLDRLAQADLVRAGTGGFAPAHDLIGETLRAGMDPSDRACLHGLVARALQAEEGDPSEIALHLVGAGDHNAATGALETAARERLERYANEEAERLAEAGLRLNPTPAQALSLLETRAEARARRGDSQGAREDFRTIVARRTSGPGRAAALIRIAELTSGFEDYEHASEVIELALSEAGGDQAVRARALGVAALLDLNLNRADRAQLRSDEALRMYEQLGDAFGAATILDLRAMVAFFSGQFRETVGLFDRVIRLFSDVGALVRLSTPFGLRGLCRAFLGEPDLAFADLDAGTRILATLGMHEDLPAGEWVRSEVLAVTGRVPEALAHAEDALAMATRLGHREWKSGALFGIGGARLAAGDWDEAERALRRCLETAVHLPAFSSWASARLALALVGQGRGAEAEPFLAHAFEGPAVAHYEARLAQAQLLAVAGDPGATAFAAEALRLAEAGGHLVSARALRSLAQEG